MLLNNITLTILVKGRPITEYPHNGQIFVEGRSGSEYEIELRNQTYRRVEAILSVDGLSVIDGQPAGLRSRGYLIGSHDVLRIPGWTLNTASVAKFAFAAQQASYAAQIGQDTRNVGVIGAMVFAEKLHPWMTPLTINATYYDWSQIRGVGGLNASAQNMGTSSASADRSITTQSIGTGFGSAQTFATKEVSFERGDLLATLLCYYDERRGLKARGIKLARHIPASPPAPQAFPAMGCPPPPGWQGEPK